MYFRLSLFIAFAFFLSCSSNAGPSQAEAPDIQIQIEGLSQGQALLIGMYTGQQYKVDSSDIDANGNMRFQQGEPYKAGYYFLYLESGQSLQLLIDKDQTFSMNTKIADINGSMVVKGSIDNEQLYESIQFENAFQPSVQAVNQQMQGVPESDPKFKTLLEQQNQLIEERKVFLESLYKKAPNSFFTTFKLAGQNPDITDVRNPDGTIDKAYQLVLYRNQFWDNVDFNDNRLLYTPVIGNKINRYITELTPQNPDSINFYADLLLEKVLDKPEFYKYLSNWIALKYEPTKTTLMDSEAVYVHMVQNYFTYERAEWADSAQVYALQLRATEMSSSLIGKKGPDVQAKDPNGNVKSIYELKSPYIAVYLYNPTCDHCIEETPKLVQFARSLPGGELSVYAIAVDTEAAEWIDFIQKNGMDIFSNVFDPTNQSIYGKYYVDNTPEIYILNPDRTIIGKNLKVNQIQEIINRDKFK